MTIPYESVDINAHHNSTVNVVEGGKIANLTALDSSNLNISGGLVSWLNAYDSSNVNITGGDISWLYAHDSSNIDISGGDISWLYANDSTEIEITSLDSLSYLYAADDSLVHLYGTDFLYQGGRLSGVWENGIGFSFWAGTKPGQWTPDGSSLPDNFILHSEPVPEPATMILFGTGLAGLIGIRSRSRNK